MKEFNEIVSRSSYELANNLTLVDTYIAFYRPAIISQIGFGGLFDEKDDKERKYAIAIAINSGGRGIKAALIDVDQVRYQTDIVYKEECRANARKLFGISNDPA